MLTGPGTAYEGDEVDWSRVTDIALGQGGVVSGHCPRYSQRGGSLEVLLGHILVLIVRTTAENRLLTNQSEDSPARRKYGGGYRSSYTPL